MAETKMLEILTELQKDMKAVKSNQETTNEQIAGIYNEMNKKLEELDGNIKEMDIKFAELRKMVLENDAAKNDAQGGGTGIGARGVKHQRTGLESRRAASVDGRTILTKVVLLGFPNELMQPTLQRAAESVRQIVGHSGAQPKIKTLRFFT